MVFVYGVLLQMWQGRYLCVILLSVFLLPLAVVWPLFDDRTFYFKSEDDDLTICIRLNNGVSQTEKYLARTSALANRRAR